ncbi:MAG: hypothetical protein KDA79_17925, partial [Planctomycetaceae bacterium]|nr:hypothetical protein [Planctomycetaceae bacterium]
MGESFKAICSLLLIIALIAGALAWFDDRPDDLTWLLRVGCPLVAIALAGLLVKLQFRQDLAPDFLHQQFGGYFNRDGFCFLVVAGAQNGVGLFSAFYQNQRDVPSHGRIALRPARGFFLTRARLEGITFDIDCQPGEYGVVHLPVPLPHRLQGSTQKFEVGASVDYPAGRGRRLRFRDGIFLRSNTRFGSGFTTAVALAGAAGGMIALSRPATANIPLPA